MRSTRTVLIALGAAVVLVLSVAAVASAGGSAHEVTRIGVEAGLHELGDGANSEGVSWETTVRVPPRQYEAATTAHIELRLSGTGGGEDSIVVNGMSLALPDTQLIAVSDFPFASKVMISLPLGWLQPGSNTIRVEAGQLGPNPSPTNTHDDFVFGEVALLLSS